MHDDVPGYGLWWLAFINSAIFIIFAFSFTKPRSSRDWRSFSAFSAFIVALFVEMYGFPLTIYLLSGWLVRNYPGVDVLSHDAGHLLSTLIGWKIDPHFDPLHILSNVLIVGGFILIMLGFLFQWPTLVTLIMFPILVTMYVRLARREEREVVAEFGEEYARYASVTPAFFPRVCGATAKNA